MTFRPSTPAPGGTLRCVRCGSTSRVEAHHVAGRSLDPAVIPLCRACHGGSDGIHARLRGWGIDTPSDEAAGLGPLGPVELIVRRVAVLVDFIDPDLEGIADALARAAAAVLDQAST